MKIIHLSDTFKLWWTVGWAASTPFLTYAGYRIGRLDRKVRLIDGDAGE